MMIGRAAALAALMPVTTQAAADLIGLVSVTIGVND